MIAPAFLLLAVYAEFGALQAPHGQAPPAGANARPPLFEDLGAHSHPVTTAIPEAQRYFDQGLRLLYAFNHDEAERAFREAARLDASCAMAWWGVAAALGPNINLPIDPDRNTKALLAIAQAEVRLGKASEREKHYVRAIRARHSKDPLALRDALDRDYATAMRELKKRFPDDLDAATLYAEALMDLRPWRLWNADGTPAEGTLEIVAVLEDVLRREPGHPGANHYYIHTLEASPFPERALPSADRLPALVPGAGHLVHMPAHIRMRTGDFQGAALANAEAARVDEKYFARFPEKGVYWLMYYNHNLHFQAGAAAMAGRSADAEKVAAQLATNVAPFLKDMPMGEFFMPMPLYVALRFQKWDKVLGVPEPDAAFPASRALRHFGRALAFSAKADAKSAAAEREAFAREQALVPKHAALNLNPASAVLEMAELTLDARLAAARGERGKALQFWSQAVEAETRLVYDEPPIWYYPPRESLGGELLRAGRFSEAEAVFRDDLRANPRNGRSLFGLMNALQGQKRDGEAALVKKEFEKAWSGADVKLRVEDL